MAKPKKQHYVPQFLLRRFSANRRGEPRLWVLDKRSASIYRSSIRDIAHENMFYEYHGPYGDIELERLMKYFDSHGSRIISAIAKDERLPNDTKSRQGLAYFVAVQMLRTPMTRNDMENIRQILVHKWGPQLRVHPDDPKTIGEYGPEDARRSSLQMMRDVPQFAEYLQDHVWLLCKAPRAVPYIISDNPVTRHNMIDRWPRGNLGLKNEGIEIHMPVSARLMIYVICKKLASAALLTPGLAGPLERAIESLMPIDHKPENAVFVNSLQVKWAERFVFAGNPQQLEMPSDMLRTNPELRDGPSVRQKPGEDIPPPPRRLRE